MHKNDERRADRRLLCAELVEVIWSDTPGRQKRRIANLEDISTSGVCLQMENTVELGTSVRMLCGNAELTGIVRYAVYRESAYFIGIELEEDSQWSLRRFVPEHLLDPVSLTQPSILHMRDKELFLVN